MLFAKDGGDVATLKRRNTRTTASPQRLYFCLFLVFVFVYRVVQEAASSNQEQAIWTPITAPGSRQSNQRACTVSWRTEIRSC